MKRIAVFCHHSESRQAKVLVAQLRRLLDVSEYDFWTQTDSESAFGSVAEQLEDAVRNAWVVMVLVGAQGLGSEFHNLTQGAIKQRIADEGRKVGRLIVDLEGGAGQVPDSLRNWVSVAAGSAEDAATVAQRVLDRLGVRARWSAGLAIEKARLCLDVGADKPLLLQQFNDVVQHMAVGKPLTITVGPYAAVEDGDGGSCPSLVRQRLLAMIDDPSMRSLLLPLDELADQGAIPPLLWQDYLATLCVLSGRSRIEVAASLDEAFGLVQGDETGEPQGTFKAIGQLTAQLGQLQLPRQVGLPALTLLTVSPCLRLERALIAANCTFERASICMGSGKRPQLHHVVFKPNDAYAQYAEEGLSPSFFLPPGVAPPTTDQIAFVRLVKLFGSRDLDGGVPCGDLGEAYDFVGHLKRLLEEFVTAAGCGPYLVLGGGLSTPPLQAAHSVLLRSALEKPEKRPRLVIVPASSTSADPLRRFETMQGLSRLIAMPDSGFDRLKVVPCDPVRFLGALTVAFGGAVVASAQRPAA